ncbi:hypothetical protein B0H14DRAFT_2635706 [Mycena olivaceomarginata]|nr:hypothetical protein B0H14DRAFT_2635706 [Mycena olivaceomarginata]
MRAAANNTPQHGNGSALRQRKGQRKCQRQRNGASGNASTSKNGAAPAEMPAAAKGPCASGKASGSENGGGLGEHGSPRPAQRTTAAPSVYWSWHAIDRLRASWRRIKTPRQQNGFRAAEGATAPEMPAAAKMAPHQRKC